MFCILWLRDSLVLTLVRMLLPRDLAVTNTGKHQEKLTSVFYSIWSTTN